MTTAGVPHPSWWWRRSLIFLHWVDCIPFSRSPLLGEAVGLAVGHNKEETNECSSSIGPPPAGLIVTL